jgi:uncharacterized protein YecT (DUF1311 family)
MMIVGKELSIRRFFVAYGYALVAIVVATAYPASSAQADNPCEQPNEEAKQIAVQFQGAIPKDAARGEFLAQLDEKRRGATTALSLSYGQGGRILFAYRLYGREEWGFGTISAEVFDNGKRLIWRHHSPGSGRYYCGYEVSIDSGRLTLANTDGTVLWSGSLVSRSSKVGGSTLSPAWNGIWDSEDGKTTMTISAPRIDVSELREYPGEEPRRVSYGYSWSPAHEASGDRPETFGYSDKRLTRDEVRERYETAIQKYKDDPEDFKVSDPSPSRAAIGAIGDGVYKVLWTYAGGDFASEYIIDGDRILELQDNKYYFGVRLFRRAKASGANKAGPSFDCSKARTWSEQAVCNDTALSKLDRQLASLYRSAQSQRTGSTRDALKREQRAWVKQREACESAPQSFDCLRRAYDTRISQLEPANRSK